MPRDGIGIVRPAAPEKLILRVGWNVNLIGGGPSITLWRKVIIRVTRS